MHTCIYVYMYICFYVDITSPHTSLTNEAAPRPWLHTPSFRTPEAMAAESATPDTMTGEPRYQNVKIAPRERPDDIQICQPSVMVERVGEPIATSNTIQFVTTHHPPTP